MQSEIFSFTEFAFKAYNKRLVGTTMSFFLGL